MKKAIARVFQGASWQRCKVQRNLLAHVPKSWSLHNNARFVYALYVELAEQLDATIVTTDSGMATASAKAGRIE